MRQEITPRWDDTPVLPSQAKERILKVPSGPPQEYAICSETITGVWTHYVDGMRTFPCTGESTTCWFDHRVTSCRWQGWLAVQRQLGHDTRWMCVTAGAARDCPRLLDLTKSLRGILVSVGRSGRSPNSRLWVVIAGRVADARKLFNPIPTRAFLLNLWGQPWMWPGRCTQEGRVEKPLTSGDSMWDQGEQINSEVGKGKPR